MGARYLSGCCGLRLCCESRCGPLMLRNLCSGCGAKFPWQWKAKRGLADDARESLEKYGDDRVLQHCKTSLLSFIYRSLYDM